jgi:uncharacterized protein (TIGR00369 family)
MKIDLETARRFFASSPFLVELGIEPTAVDEGRVSAAMALARRHQQHTGVVHAGVLATLADHAMGAAAQTMAPEGHWVLTAELKTSLLRGAKGERLTCDARVLKPGKLVTFTEAEVWCEADGRRILVMKASATMAVAPA